jgi:hypothetical protein|tara:strand:- start:15060 stop:15293 length:234 start_codon:yes stop_codon:yes gene_type:complete
MTDMSMMICTHHDATPVVTEAISQGTNGFNGIITIRFGDLSIQLDDHTAELIETGLQASREKLKHAIADKFSRRTAA